MAKYAITYFRKSAASSFTGKSLGWKSSPCKILSRTFFIRSNCFSVSINVNLICIREEYRTHAIELV